MFRVIICKVALNQEIMASAIDSKTAAPIRPDMISPILYCAIPYGYII
jgi:hypothetical protein